MHAWIHTFRGVFLRAFSRCHLAHLGPHPGHLGPHLGHLGPHLAHLGPHLGHLGPHLGHLESHFGHVDMPKTTKNNITKTINKR